MKEKAYIARGRLSAILKDSMDHIKQKSVLLQTQNENASIVINFL